MSSIVYFTWSVFLELKIITPKKHFGVKNNAHSVITVKFFFKRVYIFLNGLILGVKIQPYLTPFFTPLRV